MKRALRTIWKTVKVIFIVFCVFLGLLLFCQQRFAGSLRGLIEEGCSTSNVLVRCSDASFGFRHGLSIMDLRVFDRTRKNPLEAVFSADSIQVSLLRPRVRVVNPRLPHLHDGYYAPYVPPAEPQPAPPAEAKTNPLENLRLPRLPAFDLEVDGGEILGIVPKSVTAKVRVRPRRVELDDLRLMWPDLSAKHHLEGKCVVDLDRHFVDGFVDGFATQAQIRPLLEPTTLDMGMAVPYIDNFKGVVGPVPAWCRWTVDLLSQEFNLYLDLHPKLGTYRTVPFDRADGKLHIHVFFDRGYMNYETTVGPLTATGVDGERDALSGQIVFSCTNNVMRVSFDAADRIGKDDTIKVIEFFNDGILDCLKFDPPDSISVKGYIYPDIARQKQNNVGGEVRFAAGSLFELPMRDVRCRYDYIGDTVHFTDARARGWSGGELEGSGSIAVPGLVESNAYWKVAMRFRDIPTDDLTNAFKFTTGAYHGKLSGEWQVEGPMGTNIVDKLIAEGRVHSVDGQLNQVRLFAGLTDFMAKYVPGVGGVVNQDEGTMSFTFRDGVFRSDDIRIEGGVISIAAEGSYDAVRDNLDFDVGVRLMRDDSWSVLKYTLRTLGYVVTMGRLRFHVTGPLDSPQWSMVL